MGAGTPKHSCTQSILHTMGRWPSRLAGRRVGWLHPRVPSDSPQSFHSRWPAQAGPGPLGPDWLSQCCAGIRIHKPRRRRGKRRRKSYLARRFKGRGEAKTEYNVMCYVTLLCLVSLVEVTLITDHSFVTPHWFGTRIQARLCLLSGNRMHFALCLG